MAAVRRLELMFGNSGSLPVNVVKFCVDCFSSFEDIVIERFSTFGLKCVHCIQNFGSFGDTNRLLNIISHHQDRKKALPCAKPRQGSRAIARKPGDATTVRCGLKFTDIHYKFQSSQVSKARLQSYIDAPSMQNII